MAVSTEQIAYVTDFFSALGGITHRKMMGGATFYASGQIFAILASDDQIYLKADGALADDLAAAGARKFSMTRKNGTRGTMGYWTLPEDAVDDPDVACDWARRALAALA